jgi:hypothetical protein
LQLETTEEMDEYEEDYDAFKDCVYSTQNEYRCHYDSEKGENVCDGVKKVVRHCPGKMPEIVSEEKTVGNGGVDLFEGFHMNIGDMLKSIQLGKSFITFFFLLKLFCFLQDVEEAFPSSFFKPFGQEHEEFFSSSSSNSNRRKNLSLSNDNDEFFQPSLSTQKQHHHHTEKQPRQTRKVSLKSLNPKDADQGEDI